MPAEQPCVLLLPGLLCDASVWPAQQAALQALAPVHVADYGDCSSIAAMAERALHDAPAGPLAVVGHSMGGRVALEIWRQAPGRVVGLALLDTGFQALPDGEPGVAERAGRMELLALARDQGMRAMGQRWARLSTQPRNCKLHSVQGPAAAANRPGMSAAAAISRSRRRPVADQPDEQLVQRRTLVGTLHATSTRRKSTLSSSRKHSSSARHCKDAEKRSRQCGTMLPTSTGSKQAGYSQPRAGRRSARMV